MLVTLSCLAFFLGVSSGISPPTRSGKLRPPFDYGYQGGYLPPLEPVPGDVFGDFPRHLYGIISDNRVDQGDGNFNYNFETENGIRVEAVGQPGSQGQSNIRGSYSYLLHDNILAVVTYVADENGYRAESPLIPTPHPLPAHAIEQIRIAEEQRAAGITFE